jgi:hypothetical protein
LHKIQTCIYGTGVTLGKSVVSDSSNIPAALSETNTIAIKIKHDITIITTSFDFKWTLLNNVFVFVVVVVVVVDIFFYLNK